VCGKNMEKIYGRIGKYFIHVHHIKFISTFNVKHLIDPIKDLVTVCPNCHSMLHRKLDGEYLSIKELKNIIEQS
jgi:5-methylcytosine-specific restriction protein A